MEQNNENFLTIEEVNRLPKWAQTKVNVLHMRLREAKKEIARLIESPESNTIVGYGYKLRDTDIIQYLKNNETITFSIPQGKIRIRIQDKTLDVMGEGLTDRRICVYPRAANHLSISLIELP